MSNTAPTGSEDKFKELDYDSLKNILSNEFKRKIIAIHTQEIYDGVLIEFEVKE